jgi:hypothetical protein
MAKLFSGMANTEEQRVITAWAIWCMSQAVLLCLQVERWRRCCVRETREHHKEFAVR